MNIQKFLDSKHGNILGRVYLLIVLFFSNALIPIGAVMYFLHSMTPIVLFIGAAGTVISIAILSTPTKIE